MNTTYLFILSLALVVIGLALVSVPLAFVVAGITGCSLAIVLHRGAARLAPPTDPDGGDDE